MKKIVKFCLISIICLFCLVGCENENIESSLQEKNLSELEYLEDNILLIINKFIKGEYLNQETHEQKWEEILKDAEKIQTALATTIIDLTSLNIDNEEITKLINSTNQLVIAIENKDETNLLVELNNIYALIPNYLSKYLTDSEIIFKKQIKYYTISSYVSFKMGNIEMAKTQIAEAESQYSNKMNDINYVKNNEYNINKIYISIQELKSAIELESEELVKIKYLLLVEEI